MKKNNTHKNLGVFWGLLLCVLSVGVLFGNLVVMYHSANSQTEELGNAKLAQISHEMQMTLDDSKIMILRFASDVEVFMERGETKEKIQSYLKSQSRIFRDQSNNTLMNAYICTPEWILLSDSPLPEDYVVAERDWYSATLKNGIDNIYTSAPYVDAFTGEMCFTTALLLSDGTTVVAVDFNLEKIQKTIADMNSEGDGEALIMSRDGIIVGYVDNAYIGQKIEERLPEYEDVYTRLLNEHNDSLVFETSINGVNSKIFSNRSGEWLLIYKAGRATIFKKEYNWVWVSLLLGLILLGGMFLFFLSANRNRIKAEEALENRESFLDNLSLKMREPLAVILSSSGERGEGIHDEEAMKTIRTSAVTLSEMMNNLFSYKDVKVERENTEKRHHNFNSSLTYTKSVRNGIMAVMLVTVAVAVVFTSLVLVRWGNDRMEREVDSYNYHLENWTTTQLQTMNMFVDTIAVNPSVLADYDFAVDYLDGIVRNYPEISAAYVARPGNAHEMTMNNGWVPNADYVVAERQWYIDTINSSTGINISAPYLDARTGLYCVTFSRIVFDRRTGEQLGVFALDFYTGNLTSIMESSYSDNGYAFLVDNNNIIVNHPNAEYRISESKSTSLVGTEYDKLLEGGGLHFIRDYDGKLKVCISRTEEVTGFTVVSVKDAYTIYGFVLLSGLTFIILLAVCIILLYKLIMRMIKWQEEVRQTLTEEAERASKADRAKSSFLAQMSHEIRTPINAVLGMNEMILRVSKEEEVQEYASNAYNAGKTLLAIINDILDISKIEAGKLEIVDADYDLYSLVSDCYNMSANRAEKKGLTFTYSVDEKLPTKLRGDMFHVRQIAVNYITNAIKYTDEGSVELVFGGENDENGFSLRISVVDTGIGLTEESQKKLFESFQRFDLKRNQSVEGTGLGLSICKQLAELMGGKVFVQSEYGKGSTFGCVIPQTVVDDTPVGRMVLEHNAGVADGSGGRRFTAEKARVLVVDDVDMNIVVFKSLIRDVKLKIEDALSGRQCLEMIQKQKYDLIFMDHMMPEMDGMETYEHMKEMEHQNKDTPVVMLTANAILGEKEKYLEAGFASYLTKPIQSDKLYETLLEYLPDELIKWEDVKTETEKTENPKADTGKTEMAKMVGVNAEDIIDKKLGLSYSGNDEEVYLTILGSYVKKGKDNTGKIAGLFREEDWKDYTISVHALKSTSLTIGAERLSKMAEALEKAGKSQDYETIKRDHAAMMELYEKVLGAGEKMLGVEEETPVSEAKEISKEGTDDAPDAGTEETVASKEASGESSNEILNEISREKLLELRERLKKAAVAFDDEEIAAVFEEFAGHTCHGEELAERFAKVRELAEDFEYKDAGDLAEQIFDEIGV